MAITKREMLTHNPCTTVKDVEYHVKVVEYHVKVVECHVKVVEYHVKVVECHVKVVVISSGMSTYDME